MSDVEKLLIQAKASPSASVLQKKVQKLCTIVLEGGSDSIATHLKSVLELHSLKRDVNVKCTLLKFMAEASKLSPRSVGTMLPVIPNFVKEGVSSQEPTKILTRLLLTLPTLIENALNHLCMEPDVKVLPESADKAKTLKEMELINKVTLPLTFFVGKTIVDVRKSEVRIKCFEYIRRCILLLTCPESESETGFSLRKIQPDCTFLKVDDLQKQAREWVELLMNTLHEGKKLQPKDLRVGFKVALEVALIREQFRKELKECLLDMPKKAIWRKIMDGPENEGWALGKRAIRDIYLKMRNHELFAKDKPRLTKNLQRLGVSDTLLGKKPKKRKEDKRKRKIVPSGAKAKKQKTRPKKSEAVKRKEIQALLSLNPKLLVKLVVNVMKKWEPPADAKATPEKGISPALTNMIKKLSVIKKSLGKQKTRNVDALRAANEPLRPLKVRRLDKEQMINIMRSAYRRILLTKTQKMVAMEGKLEFHSSLLAKLYSKDIMLKADQASFITGLIDKFETRADLALRFLFILAIKSFPDYVEVCQKIIKGILVKPKVDQEEVCEFIVHLPVINKKILDTIGKIANQRSEKTVITLALCSLRDVVLQRPKARQNGLELLLSFSDAERAELSNAAVRLLTNILFPHEDLSSKIEAYAMRCLNKLTHEIPTFEARPDLEIYSQKIPMMESAEDQAVRLQKQEMISRINELKMQKWQRNESEKRNNYFRRSCALFLALCTKKPRMLHHFIHTLAKAERLTKVALSKLSVKMISTLGLECKEIYEVIESCPPGAESWVRHMCAVLLKQDGLRPTKQLIASLQKLYFDSSKDLKILIPVIEYLDRDTMIKILPELVGMDISQSKKGISKILAQKNDAVVKPIELLIRIHNLAPNMNSPLLKKAIDVIQYCLGQSVFGSEQLAQVLKQLVQQEPIPVLFMRTLIQSLLVYPSLTSFAMEILRSMILKQVWDLPDLWEGFIRCCKMSQPYSFPVLCELPRPQLEEILREHDDLLKPLQKHARDARVPATVREILGMMTKERERDRDRTRRKKRHRSRTPEGERPRRKKASRSQEKKRKRENSPPKVKKEMVKVENERVESEEPPQEQVEVPPKREEPPPRVEKARSPPAEVAPDESGFIPVLAEDLEKSASPPKEGPVIVSLRLSQTKADADQIDKGRLLFEISKLCGVPEEHFRAVEFAPNGDTTLAHFSLFPHSGRSAGNVANKLKRRVRDDDLMKTFKYNFDSGYYKRHDNERQPSKDKELREERKRSVTPPKGKDEEQKEKDRKEKDSGRRRRRRSRSRERRRSRSPRRSRSRGRRRSRDRDRRRRSKSRERRRRDKRERND